MQIVIALAALAAAAWIGAGLYNGLKVRAYTVRTGKVTGRVRLCLVTDLHSCDYGEGQEKLTRAIDEGRPDAVVMAGDIFDDKLKDENVEELLGSLAGRYPVYYVTGNHEYWSGAEAFRRKMDALKKYGVCVLTGRYEVLEAKGQRIAICGAGDPAGENTKGLTGAEWPCGFSEQLDRAAEAKGTGLYTVLLCHRPERFEEYAGRGFDLALCGHAHGGQWRVPGLINGVYAPDQGLFPRLAGGRYVRGGTTMIVSRGLARESTRVPRFYNPPEVVMVDIVPESGE